MLQAKSYVHPNKYSEKYAFAHKIMSIFTQKVQSTEQKYRDYSVLFVLPMKRWKVKYFSK